MIASILSSAHKAKIFIIWPFILKAWLHHRIFYNSLLLTRAVTTLQTPEENLILCSEWELSGCGMGYLLPYF